MSLLRALVVVASLGGIAAAAPRTEPPKAMAPADVDKWITFFDKLVDTVVKSQATCDQLATDVSVVIDANKDAIAIARQARATGRKLPEAAQQHMLESVKKMVPAMQKCSQHDKVRAAFGKLDLNRRA